MSSSTRRAGWLRVGLLGLPFAVALLGAKLQKFQALGTKTDDLARVTAADFVFVVLLLAPGMAVAFVPWRAVRGVVFAVLHVVLPLVTVLACIEHAFFRTTGSVGDGFLLVEVVRRRQELAKVIESEITPLRWAIFLAPFGWSVLVAVLVPWMVRHPRTLRYSAWAFVALGIGVIGLAVGTSCVPAKGLSTDLLALRRDVVVGLAADFVEMRRAPDPKLLTGSHEILDSVELRRRPGKPRAENLVLILLESTSAKATSLYPDYHYPAKIPTTPVLASLASRGALVEHAYSVVPHTSKALVSALCGYYPKLNFRIDEATGGGIPTACLARLLREEGFATGYFQAAEQSYENRSELVAEMGFEHFLGKERIDGRGFDESSYFGFEDDALVEPFLDWVGAQTKPFFATVLTVTSHHPYSIPKGFPTKRFVDDERLNDYLNTVSYGDRFVGKVVAGLEKQGRMADTLVMVIGDHGEAFGEHGKFQHDSTVYEETLRVPLVLYGAGITAGTHIAGLRQHVDLLATGVDALGFEPSRPFFGKSILSTAGHDQVFLSCFYQRFCRGIRDATHKYVDNFGRRGLEVYDLIADPDEKNDLAKTDPAWLERAEKKRQEMEHITDETNDRYGAQSRTRIDAFVTDKRPPISHPLDVDFGTVKLVGYSLEPETMEAGGTAYLTLFYYVKKKPEAGLLTFVHVRGHKLLKLDHTPVGGAYPVADWRPGQYVRDRFPVRTRPRYPAMDFKVLTGFYKKGGGRVEPKSLLPVSLESKAVRLSPLHLTRPVIETDDYTFENAPVLPHPVSIRFGNAIELLSAALDRSDVKAGIKVHTAFVWRALGPLPPKLTMRIRMEGPATQRFVYEPVLGDFPFAAWKPNQYVVDAGEILTPENMKTGAYRVVLEVADGPTTLLPTGTGLEVHEGAVTLGNVAVVMH